MEMQISDVIGSKGKYQLIVIVTTFYACSLFGLLFSIVELIAPEVDMYWDWDAQSPNRTVFNSMQCKMEDILRLNKSSNVSSFNSSIIYYSIYSHNTLTEKLGLVCEQSWLISFSNSVISLGYVVGGLVNGILEKKLGRRKILICASLLSVVTWFSILLTQNIVMFLILCSANAVVTTIISIIFFIQAIEISPISLRTYFGTAGKYGFLFGQFLIVFVSWLLKDWFYIQLFIAVFSVSLIPSACYMRNSPLWLIANKKIEEARSDLILISKRNGLTGEEILSKIERFIHELQIVNSPSEVHETGNFSDLFKNRVIITYVSSLSFIMAIILFIYFALLMNVESFGNTLYEDLAISHGMSTVLLVIFTFIIKIISLRTVIGCLLVMAGVISALYPFLYQYKVALTVIPAVTRTLISPGTVFIGVYMAEVLPTTVRIVGTGFISIASLLVLLSPFTKELAENTVVYVPFIIFSALSFIAAFLFKFLPETKGRPLVQTVDELILRRNNEERPPIYTINTKL